MDSDAGGGIEKVDGSRVRGQLGQPGQGGKPAGGVEHGPRDALDDGAVDDVAAGGGLAAAEAGAEDGEPGLLLAFGGLPRLPRDDPGGGAGRLAQVDPDPVADLRGRGGDGGGEGGDRHTAPVCRGAQPFAGDELACHGVLVGGRAMVICGA